MSIKKLYVNIYRIIYTIQKIKTTLYLTEYPYPYEGIFILWMKKWDAESWGNMWNNLFLIIWFLIENKENICRRPLLDRHYILSLSFLFSLPFNFSIFLNKKQISFLEDLRKKEEMFSYWGAKSLVIWSALAFSMFLLLSI